MDDTNRLNFFLLGLGIGTVSGLFLAPKSGTETRNYLQPKARGGSNYIKRQGGELRDRANQAYRKAVENRGLVSTPIRSMPPSNGTRDTIAELEYVLGLAARSRRHGLERSRPSDFAPGVSYAGWAYPSRCSVLPLPVATISQDCGIHCGTVKVCCAVRF
jgi:hypothetical protein